jgi:hypothetical protein
VEFEPGFSVQPILSALICLPHPALTGEGWVGAASANSKDQSKAELTLTRTASQSDLSRKRGW